jgi:hypothetical protein
MHFKTWHRCCNSLPSTSRPANCSHAEERIMAERTNTLTESAHSASSDIEQVFRRHMDELGDKVKDELGKLTSAGTAFGGGVGMAMLGTVLGGLAFVHLAHRVTGLPLWLCYAGSSALACTTGAGLFAVGTRKVSNVRLFRESNGHASGHNGHIDAYAG